MWLFGCLSGAEVFNRVSKYIQETIFYYCSTILLNSFKSINKNSIAISLFIFSLGSANRRARAWNKELLRRARARQGKGAKR